MLVDLLAKSPATVRPDLLPLLISISDGRDRMGNLNPAKGPVLRAALLHLAEEQRDRASIAHLTADAGHRAEKSGDLIAAVMAWRRAVTAGSTDAKVADRFTIWLVKQGEHAEAAHVLQQALTAAPTAVTVRERLEKRLARCEKTLS
jgi:Tfp pilus assembly protein PilF